MSENLTGSVRLYEQNSELKDRGYKYTCEFYVGHIVITFFSWSLYVLVQLRQGKAKRQHEKSADHFHSSYTAIICVVAQTASTKHCCKTGSTTWNRQNQTCLMFMIWDWRSSELSFLRHTLEECSDK